MIKAKLLAGLALGIAVMAMSAAPAGAWFHSRNGTPQGQAKLGVTTLTTGGATISCQTASGEWHIQTKGRWWEHEVNGKQEKTTEGPHLYIKISKWNNCKATVGVNKVPANVAECVFQLEQEAKGSPTNATATVAKNCLITIPLGKAVCEIVVTAGNHEGINEGLTKVKGENIGTNVFATAEVEGIHGEGESGKECKIENFTNGKFKSEEKGLRGEELELV